MEKYSINKYKVNYNLEGIFDPESKENQNLKKNIFEFYKNLEDYVCQYNIMIAEYNKRHTDRALPEYDFQIIKKDIRMYWGSRSISDWFCRYIHYRITNTINPEYKDYYDFFQNKGARYVQDKIAAASNEEILAYIKYFMDSDCMEYEYNEYKNTMDINIKKMYLMLYIKTQSSKNSHDFNILKSPYNSNCATYKNYKNDYGIYSRFNAMKALEDSQYYDALTCKTKQKYFENDISTRLFMDEMVGYIKEAGLHNDDMTFSEIINKGSQVKKQKEHQQFQLDVKSGKVKISVFDKIPIKVLRFMIRLPDEYSWILVFLPVCIIANRGLSAAIFIITTYLVMLTVSVIASYILDERT